jgi:4-hydroxy-tetrahydrodipicolinate synthase
MIPFPSGSITALATPFRAGRLDPDALASMTGRQIDAGTAAIVVGGSTGEAAMLTAEEYARAVSCVAANAGGRPVIAGCSASATEQSVAIAEAAARAGATGLLLAPPPYVKPTQAGLFAHVRAVAHATGLPVMFYDIPGRAGVAAADATVARLFEAGLIAALKDATADLSRPPRLRALCGPELAQFTGEDATALAHRAMGGVGCVSVTANVVPRLCAALHRAWDAGRLAETAALRDLLEPLHAALFAESNPIPLKAALSELGLCADDVRLPLTRATEETRERLRAVLEAVMTAEARARPMLLAVAV